MKTKKVLCTFVFIIMLANLLGVTAFAKANTSDSITYASADEFHEACKKELEEQGIIVIGGDSTTLNVTSENLLRSPSPVQVSWHIGYNPSSRIGLCSYTRIYSEDLYCLLKSVRGAFTYDDNDIDCGAYSINTTLTVPTYQISNAIETRKTFASGTFLECQIYGDVDAVSEITGGEFEFVDFVTIP